MRFADKRAAAREPARAEETWRGHVQVQDGHGVRWARVALPESVMRQYLVGDVEPPNTRGIVIAKIETELGSDRFTDGRWPR